MVQLNPVPVFGTKKTASTIWRKFFNEISVQTVSCSSPAVFAQFFSMHFPLYLGAWKSLGLSGWKKLDLDI